MTEPTWASLTAASELRQVDLAQRTVVDGDVHGHAAALRARPDRRPGRADALALLVVQREVLDVADHTLRLGAVDPRHAEAAHQERVLPIALERPAPERRAHDVHGRGEDD